MTARRRYELSNLQPAGTYSGQNQHVQMRLSQFRCADGNANHCNGFTQAKAALFCLEQIADENTTEDLRVAFGKLLSHSLSHACQSPELTTNIQNLLTQHPTICKRLPLVTTKAIADYLRRFPTPSRSQKPRTAAGVVPKASPTPQHPPSTVPTPSTKATTGQKASTTPTPSTALRRAQNRHLPRSLL